MDTSMDRMEPHLKLWDYKLAVETRSDESYYGIWIAFFNSILSERIGGSDVSYNNPSNCPSN